MARPVRLRVDGRVLVVEANHFHESKRSVGSSLANYYKIPLRRCWWFTMN